MESHFHEAAQQARLASDSVLETLLYHRSTEVLEALLDNPRLGEKHLAILLTRKELTRPILNKIAQNKEWMKSYPLKLAVVKHPRTPRHLSLPLLKFLYLFDLVGVAMTPSVPAELRRVAEDAILAQREGISLGERLSLARRGSQRVIAALLADSDRRVIEAALSNPSLTEQAVAAALRLARTSRELTEAVMNHPRWSARHGVKAALFRSQHLSLARLMGLLPQLSPSDLTDLASDPFVARNVRLYVAKIVKARTATQRGNSV